MALISYTQDNLKDLHDCCSQELQAILEDINFNPEEFKKMMKGLPKEYKFLYNTPLEELPLLIHDDRIHGFLMFRFKIGK